MTSELLKIGKNLLNENGKLIVFVPAFMSLWSLHDEVNMHFRRYTKKELVEKLDNAGFSIEKSSYWNFILFFPILIFRKVQKFRIKPENKSDGDLKSNRILNFLFYHLLNIENKLLKLINFPFGISVFCISSQKKR